MIRAWGRCICFYYFHTKSERMARPGPKPKGQTNTAWEKKLSKKWTFFVYV